MVTPIDRASDVRKLSADGRRSAVWFLLDVVEDIVRIRLNWRRAMCPLFPNARVAAPGLFRAPCRCEWCSAPCGPPALRGQDGARNSTHGWPPSPRPVRLEGPCPRLPGTGP